MLFFAVTAYRDVAAKLFCCPNIYYWVIAHTPKDHPNPYSNLLSLISVVWGKYSKYQVHCNTVQLKQITASKKTSTDIESIFYLNSLNENETF